MKQDTSIFIETIILDLSNTTLLYVYIQDIPSVLLKHFKKTSGVPSKDETDSLSIP